MKKEKDISNLIILTVVIATIPFGVIPFAGTSFALTVGFKAKDSLLFLASPFNVLRHVLTSFNKSRQVKDELLLRSNLALLKCRIEEGDLIKNSGLRIVKNKTNIQKKVIKIKVEDKKIYLNKDDYKKQDSKTMRKDYNEITNKNPRYFKR